MKLKKVEPNKRHTDWQGKLILVKCGCCSCHKTINDITKMYADLDGSPYNSYYCQECADNIKNRDSEIFSLEQQQSRDGE